MKYLALSIALAAGASALLAASESLLRAPSSRRLDPIVRRMEVGKPIRYRGLTVFPVTLRQADPSGYLTLDEALRKGLLRVTEVGSGSVNEVYVTNESDRHVFMMAGEVIVGAKQDRMVTDDTLVPPRSGKLLVKVYCTEHGRWSGPTLAFESSALGAYPSLRAQARASGSQSVVWDEVRRKRGALAPEAAPTEALRAVQADREVQRKLDTYRSKELVDLPKLSADTVGVVVALDGQIKAADVFGSHDLLTRLWSKLLDSYAMDAVEVAGASWRDEVTVSEARRFLRTAIDAVVVRKSTPGVGELLSVQANDVTGQALLYQDDLVHLELFPRATRLIRQPSSGGLRSPYRVNPRRIPTQ